MKILYITTISNTMHRFLIPQIKELKKAGHQVDVGFKVIREVEEIFNQLGCQIHEFNFNRSPIKNNYFSLIKEVRKVIIQGGYEIVHTHTPIASAIVRMACKSLENVKVIYTAHGFHFYTGAPLKNWLLYYPVERFLSKYTDILITINKEDYNIAKTFDANRNIYIPGVGVDLKNIPVNQEKLTKNKNKLGITPNNFILFSIGELNQNKNHKVVLEALSKINNKEIKYIIAGSGNLETKLIDKVKELNLENQVKLLGYRDDIYELLELSDVFILPSHREGLSKALMEAMAMGKPIIASDIRGNRDLIDDKKGGLLFSPTNEKQLSDYIIEMMSNSTFRENASKYNVEKIKKFSLENVLNKMKKSHAIM